ncbi:MAG: sodium-translocating pyrophosphatase [Candidatus Hydrogenedentota bacterium]|nr:MAG: sodium-translocating pyrophosphatase [Candidatus Hydrogenedentota bacterium]
MNLTKSTRKKWLGIFSWLAIATALYAQASGSSQDSDANTYLLVAIICAAAALVYALFTAFRLLKRSEGTDEMVKIASAIREGADAFLKKQYMSVAIFVVIVAGALAYLYGTDPNLQYGIYAPIAFVTGAVTSGLAGYIGMKIATRANARTAWAAKESLNTGLRVAFSSGSIMGMTVVGLGLLLIGVWYLVLDSIIPANYEHRWDEISNILFTFGMGASSVALFARVGGGIYTKAADVGADLVGKVEAGIPEDDPRNPATIADNVGDNVGDVAGMGADLFESYVGSIVGTMALAAAAFSGSQVLAAAVAPLFLAGAGILASIIGTFLVRTKEEASQESLLWSLRIGIYVASILVIVFTYLIINNFLGLDSGIFWAVIAGLVAGNVIGYFTEYYTSDTYRPTVKVSESSKTGHATVIISGIALGMRSTLIPVLTVVIATIVAYYAAGGSGNPKEGLFGIGMAAVGMLSTLGITLSTDAYGPVADNAGGVAEMSDLEPQVRERTDALDSLGNTTAATGKGFAIGSAALTALTLLAALSSLLKGYIHKFTLTDPLTLSGLFIGAMVPFFFSALTMEAVGKAAMSMVEEVRRQFREIKGIMEGTGKPDYQRCVAISTAGALREMIAPTLLAIITPIGVGLFLGPAALIAMLAGTLVSGFSIAIMMANAGGAWDNAKKYIERGNFGGKGSDNHKAAVTGDTVGDPFKDTSGPSINILIKLMSMVSLVFGPFLAEAYKAMFGS